MQGGVLFAVVGAKLSEGINFSDNLARAVVICGTSKLNLHCTLRLIDTNRNPLSECTIDRIEGANEISKVDAAARQTFDRSRRRTSPLYVDLTAPRLLLTRLTDQNLAFRAVNQSIGRAIRHQNDWASIILLDARYAVPSAQAKLPAWLGSDVERPASFGSFVGSLAKFVKRRVGESRST